MRGEVEIVIKWNGKFALTFVQCRAESSAAQSTIPDVSSPPSCRCMCRVVDTLMSTCCHRRMLVHWGSSSTRNAASQMARPTHRTARVVSSTRREVQQRLSWTFFAVNNSLSITSVRKKTRSQDIRASLSIPIRMKIYDPIGSSCFLYFYFFFLILYLFYISSNDTVSKLAAAQTRI